MHRLRRRRGVARMFMESQGLAVAGFAAGYAAVLATPGPNMFASHLSCLGRFPMMTMRWWSLPLYRCKQLHLAWPSRPYSPDLQRGKP
jgi:hypothetical protein